MKIPYIAERLGKMSGERTTGRSPWLRTIGNVIWRILVWIIAFVLCLPVFLLPTSTEVPGWIWAPLAVFNLLALIWLARPDLNGDGLALAVAGLLVTGILALMASQAFAAIPPIIDANGVSIPGPTPNIVEPTIFGSVLKENQ